MSLHRILLVLMTATLTAMAQPLDNAAERNLVLHQGYESACRTRQGLTHFLEALNTGLQAQPQDPVRRYWRAAAGRDLRLLTRARADAELLLQADPRSEALHLLAGEIAGLDFRTAEAREHWARAGDQGRQQLASTDKLARAQRSSAQAQWIALIAGMMCCAGWMIGLRRMARPTGCAAGSPRSR